jgi:hypothetical protein
MFKKELLKACETVSLNIVPGIMRSMYAAQGTYKKIGVCGGRSLYQHQV